MGRQKLGNKMRKRITMQSIIITKSSLLSLKQIRLKSKACKSANDTYAGEFASEFNVQQNQNNSVNKKLEANKSANNQYGQEFGSYAEVESAKMNNAAQKA